jgi:hypothetical protein
VAVKELESKLVEVIKEKKDLEEKLNQIEFAIGKKEDNLQSKIEEQESMIKKRDDEIQSMKLSPLATEKYFLLF